MALSLPATWISATPVAGPSISRTPELSTSLSARKPRRLLANASLPTAPIIAVGAPRRAAATAWLRPLPPGRNDTAAPSSVSPGTGRRALCTTTSMLRLPQTTTRLIGSGSFHPGRQRQLLLAQEVRIEQLGLIALAAVGQDGDDGLAGAEVAGEPHGSDDVDPRRAAQHEALMLDQVEQGGQGFLVGDLIDHVDRRALEVGGDATVADALGDRASFGFQFTLGVPVVERRAHRVAERNLDVGIALLERARDSAQSPAGADRAGEAVDLAIGLVPDLRSGGAVVAFAVGDIVELVGPDGAVRLLGRKLLGERAGVAYVVAGIGVRQGRYQPEVGATQAQHVLLFLALRLRHHDHRAIAARVGDQRDADAGIAGGALDDDAAGLELAPLFGILDDGKGGAILHRAPGIEKLRLA